MLPNLDTVATVLLIPVLAVICRQMVQKGYVRNPFDRGERDFQLAPVLKDATWCAVCFTAAFAWTTLFALAIKHRVLPDTYWTAYGLLLVPLFGFVAAGALLLGRTLITTMFGKRK